jgi:RNA polymerase sigma factor (sigma-70 family)
MNLPANVNRQEFEAAVARIMKAVQKKYRANIYDGEDLAQEVFAIALERIPKYDPSKGPIFNWLSVTVRSRILNIIRNTNRKEVESVSLENVEEEMIRIGNMKTTSDEFWEIIDEQLPAEYRFDYIKMKQGVSLPNHRRLKLIAELKKIVSDEF